MLSPVTPQVPLDVSELSSIQAGVPAKSLSPVCSAGCSMFAVLPAWANRSGEHEPGEEAEEARRHHPQAVGLVGSTDMLPQYPCCYSSRRCHATSWASPGLPIWQWSVA
eukprot:10114521-Alexandrium_andersonii.AAC.1